MSDHDLSAARRKKPLALTFFCLLAAGGLIAMPYLAGPPAEDKMPDIVRFIGHFHPVLLHLPIGIFVLILFQELRAIFGKRGGMPDDTALFPLFCGAASAVIAVIAGFLLFHGHGDEYGGSAIATRHLWGGLIFAVAAIITFIFKAWSVASNGNGSFYRLLLFASVGVMTYASHDGASITHGEGYLTKYAPAGLKRLLGEAKPAVKDGEPVVKDGAPAVIVAKPPEQQIAYVDIVAPIFEHRCGQCHNETKAKGKYRMDRYDLLVKGGKVGHAIEPGKPANSEVLKRIALPKDDDEHMPPEGKPAIEESEVAIIKWWIESGADAKKLLKDYEVPAPIKAAIAKIVPAPAAGSALTGSAAPAPAPAPAPTGPDEALKAKVAAISKDFPGALSFESQGSVLLTFTAVSMRANLDDAAFKKLEPVSSKLVTVDLSATKITDQGVTQLSAAKSLRVIRLAETGVTDAAIETLLKLPSLESINLYGTKVTDAGVSKLSALTKLKRLYLWQTAVTPAAIKTLKEKLPGCEIVTGIDS